MTSRDPNPDRPCQSWPMFSAPLRLFASVMGPIAAMMLGLASLSGMPTWLRISAAGIVALSIRTAWKGYGCRVRASKTHVSYRSLGQRISIPWSEIKAIASYIPLDRNLQTKYVYITRLDTPPVDRREIDENTLQLQDRPGLVESLQTYWKSAPSAEGAPTP